MLRQWKDTGIKLKRALKILNLYKRNAKCLEYMISDTGMSTIEACIIIPISITLIMLVIWTAFYNYNCTAVAAAVAKASEVAVRHPELDNEELCEECMYVWKKSIEGKLIFMDVPEVNVVVEYGKVTVTASGSFDIREFLLSKNMGENGVYIVKSSHTSPRLRSSEYVRRMAILKEIELPEVDEYE